MQCRKKRQRLGGPAVFSACNQLAVTDMSHNQVIKNRRNKVIKKSSRPVTVDAIFCAGT